MKKLFQQTITLLTLMACSTPANASIISTWADNPTPIYHDYSSDPPGYVGGSTGYALDLNEDGTDDISFMASWTEVGFNLLEGTRILGINYGHSGNLFSSSHLGKNDVIGNDGQIWDTGGYHSIISMMVPMSDQLIPSDPSYPNQYYIGLEITMNNQPHYGWLSIQAPNNPYNRALVSGWAYESTPNTAITAGTVPEPSSALLAIIGAISVGVLRRCQQRRLTDDEEK